MDNSSVLLTNSGVDQVSGGGIVSTHLLKSLQEVSEVKLIVSKSPFPHNNLNGVRAECIEPSLWGYAATTPFFEDYLGCCFIKDEPIDLAVTYGCPWLMSLSKLRKENITKIICDLAPHNIKLSMAEFAKQNQQYSYPHLVNPFLKELYLKHLRLADKVVVHSNSSAKYIKDEAMLKELPTVIPHGCEPPEKTVPLPDELAFGYAGALGADKGLVYLVNSVIYYPEKIMLLLGGHDSTSFMINQKYQDRFKILGNFNNMSYFYNQCSVGIFPSVTEGFGICILEMMAHARPVIVGMGAGASELVEDGKQGFVVDGRDIDEIQSKIKYFKDNPGEVKRMGLEARKTAEQNTWDIIRKRYVDVYKELINI